MMNKHSQEAYINGVVSGDYVTVRYSITRTQNRDISSRTPRRCCSEMNISQLNVQWIRVGWMVAGRHNKRTFVGLGLAVLAV
jgi:hypothetical protein